MAIINSRSTNVDAASIPECSDFVESSCPERRLWCAVVIAAIGEFEHWLQRIEAEWTKTGKPVARSMFIEVINMRQHLEHRWFAVICALADITQDLVLEKIGKLEKDYCFRQIPYDDGDAVISDWQRRNLKSKPKPRVTH